MMLLPDVVFIIFLVLFGLLGIFRILAGIRFRRVKKLFGFKRDATPGYELPELLYEGENAVKMGTSYIISGVVIVLFSVGFIILIIIFGS